MEVLKMSREQYCTHISNTKNQKFDKVVVGAAIVHKHANSSSPRILLLKRSATETNYPNVFEIPGGKVDSTDATIYDALVREVKEETDLEIKSVLSQLPDFTYSTEKTVGKEDGQEEVIKKHAIQLSFVVSVDKTAFRLNPAEHSVGVWATWHMLEDLKMTDDMERIVSMAFH